MKIRKESTIKTTWKWHEKKKTFSRIFFFFDDENFLDFNSVWILSRYVCVSVRYENWDLTLATEERLWELTLIVVEFCVAARAVMVGVMQAVPMHSAVMMFQSACRVWSDSSALMAAVSELMLHCHQLRAIGANKMSIQLYSSSSFTEKKIGKEFNTKIDMKKNEIREKIYRREKK